MPRVIERLVPNIVINGQVINSGVELDSAGEDIHVLQEKTYIVYALSAGAPGNLNAWIDIHPDPAGTLLAGLAALPWAQLGAVQVLAAAVGVQTLVFPFTGHVEFSRIALQAPGAGVGATWTVTVVLMGK